MDEVKAVLEFFATVGVLPVLCYLLWRLLITSQKALEDERKRSADLVQKMAEIVSAQENNLEKRLQQYQVSLDQYQVSLNLQKQGLDLLKDAVLKVDGERKTAIAENMSAIQTTAGALVTFRDETVKAFDAAVNQMTKARAQTVADVNAHTDEAHRLTGEAISASQKETTAQHAEQGEDFLKMLEDNERKFKEHVHEEVLANGDKTRADLERQLKPIFEQLAKMQKDAEARDLSMAQRIHEVSNDLSKVVLMITSPKPEPPPIDPLANLPPKSEEMK